MCLIGFCNPVIIKNSRYRLSPQKAKLFRKAISRKGVQRSVNAGRPEQPLSPAQRVWAVTAQNLPGVAPEVQALIFCLLLDQAKSKIPRRLRRLPPKKTKRAV